MQILYGGDRVASIPAELEKRLGKGDRIVVVQQTGDLLLIPAAEHDVAAEPEKFDAALEVNQDAHQAAGHWGVPLMVFEGEPFYGQDRLDLLLWRMQQKGLEKRTA